MIEGKYSDGQSSKLVPATLHLLRDWVEVRDAKNKILRRLALAQVTVTSRLGNTPRSIILGDATGSDQVTSGCR